MNQNPDNVRSQEGWVVVTAIILMTIMLGVGLASMVFIDGGTQRSQTQRQRESAFTLAEGTLYAQGFALARNWPSATSPGYPATCDSATAYTAGSVPAKQCPNAATLTGSAAAAFKSLDFGPKSTASWVTAVRDNGGPLVASYSSAQADLPQGACPTTPCTRDFNGDNTLWVQSRAMVRGRPRNVVALMKLETLAENVPQVAVTAGALAVTNNGNNLKIDDTGSQITLRCDVSRKDCVDFESSKGQIQPNLPQSGNPAPLLNASQMQRFRETAQAAGTYYAGCPPEISTAEIIFVEDCQNPPNYMGAGFTAGCIPPSGLDSSCVNSIAKPGLLVVHCGALRMTSNWTYVGVVYFANGSDNDPDHPCVKRGTTPPTCTSNSLDGNSVMDTQGGFGIWGALAADGNACILLGSNGGQVSYNKNAFSSFKTFGTVGLVQNTWRELSPS